MTNVSDLFFEATGCLMLWFICLFMWCFVFGMLYVGAKEAINFFKGK